jgi:hypothetical protein
MLGWLLVALPLFWSDSIAELKRKRRGVIIWIGAALLFVAPYFIGYTKPDHGGANPQSLSVTKIVPYFLAFLGNPFFWATQYQAVAASITVGALLLVLFVVAVGYLGLMASRKSRDGHASIAIRAALPWLAIAGFALCNGVMAATSRAGFGTEQALSSRYVIFSVQLPISLVALAAILLADVRRRDRTPAPAWADRAVAGLVAALLIVQVLVIPLSLAASEQARFRRRQGKSALLLTAVLPYNPLLKQLVHPTPDRVLAEIKKLNELHLIRPPLLAERDALKLQVAPEAAKGRIEGAIQNVYQPDKQTMGVSGFAYFPQQRRPADLVLFTYENQDREQVICATAERVVARPDIVAVKQDTSYAACGWDARFPIAVIPDQIARTKISAWAIDADSGALYRLEGEIPIQR